MGCEPDRQRHDTEDRRSDDEQPSPSDKISGASAWTWRCFAKTSLAPTAGKVRGELLTELSRCDTMWSSGCRPMWKARYMRLSLAMAGAVGSIMVIAFGLASALVGFLDQSSADKAYEVEFRHPGDECSPAHELHLSVSDGKPLPCVRAGFLPVGRRAQVEGFTEAQTDEVIKLATELGASGLSAGEQRRIQHQVDRILISVPPAKRAHYEATISVGGLWGRDLGWTAIGAVVAAALGCIGCFRLAVQ
jgi:hypothetical protein